MADAGSKLSIRDATLDDAEILYKMCKDSATEFDGIVQFHPFGTAWKVAERDGKVVAAMAYFDGVPTQRWLMDLYGDKRGIVLLKKWIESDSTERGLPLFGSVHPKNLRMIKAAWKHWTPAGVLFARMPA